MGALERIAPPWPPARAGLIAARLLSQHSPHEIAEAIGILIDVLDAIGPQTEDMPDFTPISDGAPGDPEDTEADGTDQGDQSAIEWHQLAGATKRAGGHGGVHREDAEEDDEPEEDDPSGQCDEDGINTDAQGLQCIAHHGPGCELSDPGGSDHNGCEHEQMAQDVPCLSVFTLDHNPFNDQRTLIGRSNLTTAFRGAARSADTGAEYNGRGDVRLPGVPV